MAPLSKMHRRVNAAAQAKSPERITEEQELANMMKLLDEQEVPENKLWDETNAIYYDVMTMLNATSDDMGNAMLAFTQNHELKASLTSQQAQRLTVLVQQFTKDTTQYIEQLSGIYQRHAGKSGGVTSPTEAMEVRQIQGAYHDVADLFHQLVNPMAVEILGLIGVVQQAAQALVLNKQQQAQADLQDPNVISDVVIKE